MVGSQLGLTTDEHLHLKDDNAHIYNIGRFTTGRSAAKALHPLLQPPLRSRLSFDEKNIPEVFETRLHLELCPLLFLLPLHFLLRIGMMGVSVH